MIDYLQIIKKINEGELPLHQGQLGEVNGELVYRLAQRRDGQDEFVSCPGWRDDCGCDVVPREEVYRN